METISRRNALRLTGTAASAAVVGISTMSGSAALVENFATASRRPHARTPTRVRGVLNRGTPLIGMSSPADVWDQRAREVGPGLTARRIFADLAGGADNQIRLVEEAHRAEMLPVISYKVGGDVDGAVAGDWNRVAREAARKLAAFDRPTAVTFWHEPHTDMTPAQYVAASQQILPQFKVGKLRVGPLLNGWLLDRQQDAFGEYCPDSMFRLWDWFGIDTYESGSMQNPGDYKPAQRVKALRKYLKSRGHRKMPIGIGEYNGYSGETIEQAGKVLLGTKNVWFGCVWNSTGGKGYALDGERLRAFRSTLADPRSMTPR